MKILLIGARGQLGSDLQNALRADKVHPVTHAQLDICNKAAVKQAVESVQPDCIINAAAYNRVDDCEENVDLAFGVNASGVGSLARAAQRSGALFVHFSTNYVFDGESSVPYTEDDQPRPLSVYGMSKLTGEWLAAHFCEKLLLVRTCGLYGEAGNASKGGNFVERMLQLAAQGRALRVVNDQKCTPTSTSALAQASARLIHDGCRGLFHITNRGDCTWYEFAQEIFRLAGQAVELSPVTSTEFGAKARRPAYSVLADKALRDAGHPSLRPWQEALAEYLRQRAIPS